MNDESRTPARRTTNVRAIMRIAAPAAIILFVSFHFLREEFALVLAGGPVVLFAALVVGQFGLMLFGVRLFVCADPLGLSRPLARSLAVHYQSLPYYFVLPASLGQDAVRAAKLAAAVEGADQAPYRARLVRAGATLLTDRAVGVATLAVIGIAVLPFSRIGTKLRELPVWLVAILVLAGLGGAAAAAIAKTETFRRFGSWKPPSARQLALAAAASFGGQFLLAASTFHVAVKAGLAVTLADVIAASAIATFGQIIPVSVLGVGAGEAAAYGLYVAIGLSPVEAALPIACYYAQHLFAAMLGVVSEIAFALRGGPARRELGQ